MATNTIRIRRSMLETITLALYENPIILFREYVQNALDAHNAAVKMGKPRLPNIGVNIVVNEEAEKITITDNGYGIESRQEFQERMLSLGRSHHPADKTLSIGFRGIGRLSGLPFCKQLTFRNKPANSNSIHTCTWLGEDYRQTLSTETASGDLADAIDEMVSFGSEKVGAKDKGKHFFEVVLEGYRDDIGAMLKGERFRERLVRMLPLRYDDSFSVAGKIMDHYAAFMEGDLRRFMIPVKFNGDSLFKGYDDSCVLESDIVFWEVRGKKKKNKEPGDKIGLLWFTFNRHIKDHGNDQYYGILTRSKNVLMGGNDTFAQVVDDGATYVTTFREMAQVLRGVYGELLINSEHLSDNSRRDWFLPDEHSRDLSNVMTEFMRRLNSYRYCSSRYFRKNGQTNKAQLREALDELAHIDTHGIDFDSFAEKPKEPAPETPAPADSLADKDIPRESKTMKKHYDLLMRIIDKFFRKKKNRDLFLELRAFISTHFEQK
jgi:Histidine kinase-, DNA gyrase B-, and HSP90-like ATPase